MKESSLLVEHYSSGIMTARVLDKEGLSIFINILRTGKGGPNSVKTHLKQRWRRRKTKRKGGAEQKLQQREGGKGMRDEKSRLDSLVAFARLEEVGRKDCKA